MMENNKSTKDSIFNRITAISTIMIACVAIGLSIWQGIETRNHNKLSVKPLLSVTISTSKNDSSMGVRVDNNGIGPAIIREFLIYLDGQPAKVYSLETARKIYQDAGLIIKGVDVSIIEFDDQDPGTTLKHGGRLNIISYPKENWTTEGIKIFEDALSRLGFQFIYESIYEEKFETNM